MEQDKSKIAVYVQRGDCVTPLGFNLEDNLSEIEEGKSAISLVKDEYLSTTPFYGSIIKQDLLEQNFSNLSLDGEFTDLEKMMLLAVESIKKEYSEHFNDNCGLIISSTKGNIEALENDDLPTYPLHHLANKIGKTIGINKEPIVLSNACVSGIMAVSVAKTMIQVGRYKHVLIIAGDIFSRFVFSGFQSFQAVANEPCKPYDKDRVGITLGEAAAAIFVTKDKALFENAPHYEVVGDSSINDANHISGPSRTGEGLYQSISKAMAAAQLGAERIDAISSHGTATNYNDEMEAQAFNRMKLEKTPLFSLKGYFGHTLGAAGLLELVISLGFAERNLVPQSIGYTEHGVSLPLNVTKKQVQKEVNVILKTASGFGGSNTAVIFKKCTSDEK